MPAAEPLFWAAASGASGVTGLAAFYVALSRGTMGLVAPLVALIAAALPAFVGIASGEPTGVVSLVGIALALCAVVIISLPEQWMGRRLTHVAAGGVRASELALIAAAGLGFAGFSLFIDQSHDTGGAIFWPILVVRGAGLTLVVATVVALAASGRLPPLGFRAGILPVAAAAGAGDMGGNLFFLVSLGFATLPVAVVLASLYPVVTTILARVVLGERLSPLRSLGVVVALTGVVLISLGQSLP